MRLDLVQFEIINITATTLFNIPTPIAHEAAASGLLGALTRAYHITIYACNFIRS